MQEIRQGRGVARIMVGLRSRGALTLRGVALAALLLAGAGCASSAGSGQGGASEEESPPSSVAESTSESTSDSASESVPESTEERTPERVSESTPESTSERRSESDLATTTTGGESCVDEACDTTQEQVCEPGTIVCTTDASAVWRCSSDGLVLDEEECLDGTRCEEGACVAQLPSGRTCEEADCAALNRVCLQADPETDAECTTCLPGFDEVAGGCVPEGEGSRALGERCSFDTQCPDGAWCPTDTTAPHCAPRPRVGGEDFAFQWVPQGQFLMGSPDEELGRESWREEQVPVTLSRGTFVQRTPVTQRQWKAVSAAWNARPDAERFMPGFALQVPQLGEAPSCFQSESDLSCSGTEANPDAPVERVNWWEAIVFANVLSLLEGLDPCYDLTSCLTVTSVSGFGGGCPGTAVSCATATGAFSCASVTFEGKGCSGYRLMTEAEWEWAARAGTEQATYGGDLLERVTCPLLGGAEGFAPETPLADLAWYDCNAGGRTAVVEQKRPNRWGLHDMLGNVWEWTWTRYADEHVGGTDPLGPSEGSTRTARGVPWFAATTLPRAAARRGFALDERNRIVGFRLARSAPEQPLPEEPDAP